jgi:hypothetical protein
MLIASALTLSAHLELCAQVRLNDLPSITGIWETTTPTGVEGLSIVAHGTADAQTLVKASLEVRVFRRRGRLQQWGWFSAGDEVLTGGRLVIRGALLGSLDATRDRSGPLTYDVAFDAPAQRWVGTIEENGVRRNVVLTRPQSSRSDRCVPFCGTWEHVNQLMLRRFHVARSSDGALVAWMDTASRILTSPPMPQSHDFGADVEVVELSANRLRLTEARFTCCPTSYEGNVSIDGRELLTIVTPGKGMPVGDELGNSNATFRRID